MCCVVPVSCTDNPPPCPCACLRSPLCPSGVLWILESLQGHLGAFLSFSDTAAEQSSRRPMDSAALRRWTNPIHAVPACISASRCAAFTSTGRSIPRSRDVHAGWALVARKALAGIACQSDTAARGRLSRANQCGSTPGQGSGIRGCLAGKKGAAHETSNIYHQGGITKLEQNRAN